MTSLGFDWVAAGTPEGGPVAVTNPRAEHMSRASLETRQRQIQRLRPWAIAVFALLAIVSALTVAFPNGRDGWLRAVAAVTTVLSLVAFAIYWRYPHRLK